MNPLAKMFLFPKLGPWYMAQARREIVRIVAMPLAISTEYWKTWAEVYRP